MKDLERLELFPDCTKIQLGGGRNSSVFSMQFEKSQCILKWFNFGQNREQRFLKELSFLNYCYGKNIKTVPEVISFDSNALYIIETLLPGSKPDMIQIKDTTQAGTFISSINNATTEDFFIFGDATDSFVGIEEIFEDLFSRFSTLQSEIKHSTNHFLQNPFIKLVQEMLDNLTRIRSEVDDEAQSFLGKLTISSILSPSDFGFHNTIRNASTLSFIDFEYSGMDSPLKLIGDFLMQPDYQLSSDLEESFLESLSFLFESKVSVFPAKLKYLFGCKWVLIITKSLLRSGEVNLIESKVYNYINSHRLENFLD